MTDDIKALVAELREVKPTWDAARRAADTIEALEADRDEWMERADDGYAFTSDVEELIKRAEKAEQERDYLKTQKDTLWQGLNEAKEHIVRVEQERDDARITNADLLNRINELARERDEARSQRVAQEQRAVDLAETLERARQGRDLEQLALTRAVRQIADLQQELSRLRHVAEVATTFNLGETFRELPGDREVFGS